MAITIAINSTGHTWSFKVFPEAKLAELVPFKRLIFKGVIHMAKSFFHHYHLHLIVPGKKFPVEKRSWIVQNPTG